MATFQCINTSNKYQTSVGILNFRTERFKMGKYAVKCEADLCPKAMDQKRLRILIAGGGIGGLVLALAAKNKGYEVKVFEKDLSFVRGEGRHRGPIQLSSTALYVLQAIDENIANQIMESGCVTGDRINGLADGISGEWFTQFDLLTPAVNMGLPLTRTICRMELQDILVDAVGFDILNNKSKVVDFMQHSSKVTVSLDDGRQYDGDMLVGADGIWSEVRTRLFGKKEAKYSGYTCYSGITSFVPPYIHSVGYRVFLGFNQYFVASDVGKGRMQWYAFYKEIPMNTDPPGGKKNRLLELFRQWCDEVITLISKTSEDMILRRDIYDRDMIHNWGIGCVTLLGDAAHPMQPNLGQGGCMAIEDCYQLMLELNKVVKRGSDFQISDEIVSALRRYNFREGTEQGSRKLYQPQIMRYEKKRRFRVSTVHAASRMASKMLSTYQPYIEFESGPLSYLSNGRIQTPTIHIARTFLQLCAPLFMSWIIANPRIVVEEEEEKYTNR